MNQRRLTDPDPKEDPEIGTKPPASETPEHRPSLARAVTDQACKNLAEEDGLPRIEARSRTEPGPDHPPQRPVEKTEPPIREDRVKERDGDQPETRITFDPSADRHPRREQEATLYIPGPRARDQGMHIIIIVKYLD